MQTAQTRSITAEEFWEFLQKPENEGKRFELERGEVIEVPSPGELHGVVCALITYLLTAYVMQRRCGYVCSNDTGLVVARGPDTVRGPDVQLFLEARRFQELSPKFAEHVPALVVEVLSPSDRHGRVDRRVSQYLRRGVGMVWVVDPDARFVTVHRPGQEHQTFDETEELAGDNVLPGFRCPVADLFRLAGEPA